MQAVAALLSRRYYPINVGGRRVAELTRRLAAVAFADVAGWSRLIEENDATTLHAWKALRSELIEPKIHQHGGRLLEIAGDAVLVEFPSAVAAVSWALDVQCGIPHSPVPTQPRLTLRIGINVEDVIVDSDKLVGSGVNVASRIHQIAAPGEIVITSTVFEYVANKLPATFADLGTRELKNISRPVRVYRVEAPNKAASAASVIEPGAHAILALELGEPDRAAVERILHEILPSHGGRVTARPLHALVLDFAHAQQAAAAAFELQRACRAPVTQQRPRIALQMSAGAAPEAELATHLTALAGPGEIVASAAVCDRLTPVLDADVEDLGECHVEQLGRPVRAYRLGPPGPGPVIEPASRGELRPTIAVIPFTARTAGHEVLGEILADDVICGLSRSAELNVISRLSTTGFRGREATPQQIGSQLNATYVLSGAYRVSHSRYTLAMELADVRSARVVWAREFKGRVSALLEGKDEMIHQIIADASAAVIAQELERSRSQSLPTLESYTLLIGAIALMHRLSLSDFDRAREMLVVLIERTQRLAIPQAWLAKWHVLRVQQGWSGDPQADAQSALEWSARALDADSHCSLALSIDGFVHTNLLRRLDVAEERYELALSVNPNDALAWLLKGMLHAFKGEGKHALKGTRRALRLSPLDPHRYFYDSLAASAALSAGDYEGAIELARRSLRGNRTHTSTWRVMAISQWQLGRHQEARDTVRELMRLEPTLTVSKWLERSPSSGYEIGTLCARALREAGVPA